MAKTIYHAPTAPTASTEFKKQPIAKADADRLPFTKGWHGDMDRAVSMPYVYGDCLKTLPLAVS